MKFKEIDRKNAIEIGKRCKQARLAKGYSQNFVSTKLGITASALSKLEAGNVLDPGVMIMDRLAVIYSNSLEWLVFGDESNSIVINHGKNKTVINEKSQYTSFSSYIPIFKWNEFDKICLSNEKLNQIEHPFIHHLGKGGPHSFVMKFEGISMFTRDIDSPSFENGCLLYFDPEIEPYENAFVLAFDKEIKELLFRQLITDCNIQILRPLNMQFKVIPLDKNIKIIAVLYSHRKDHDKPDIIAYKNKGKIKEKA